MKLWNLRRFILVIDTFTMYFYNSFVQFWPFLSFLDQFMYFISVMFSNLHQIYNSVVFLLHMVL